VLSERLKIASRRKNFIAFFAIHVV
jgi:hypothetical protein